MAKYTGNYSDFVDNEIKRLSAKGKLNKSEKEAISELKNRKKGKTFAKNKKS